MPVSKPLRAPLADLFVSRQGEGLYCGQKQVFIRFSGCNLNCRYCDEPAARKALKPAYISLRELLRRLDTARRGSGARAVSLTGGEPLLHAAFLNRLIPALKRRGLAVHLETNATLPQAYAALKLKPDVVAADIKLPSATRKRLWDRHARFLKLCAERVFVKTVLDARSASSEIEQAIDLMASAAPERPFFWQPATPSCRTGTKSVAPKALARALRIARRRLKKASVSRQMHVLWGVK